MIEFGGYCFSVPRVSPWKFESSSSVSGQISAMGSGSVGELNFTIQKTETKESIAILSAGACVGVGVTFPPVGVEFSLESFPFAGIDHIYVGPCGEGDLGPSDFTGYVHIGTVKCKGIGGGALSVIVFSKRIIQTPMDWLSVTAFGFCGGMVFGSQAGLSVQGCVYGSIAR